MAKKKKRKTLGIVLKDYLKQMGREALIDRPPGKECKEVFFQYRGVLIEVTASLQRAMDLEEEAIRLKSTVDRLRKKKSKIPA
jgi:hypothetical protein